MFRHDKDEATPGRGDSCAGELLTKWFPSQLCVLEPLSEAYHCLLLPSGSRARDVDWNLSAARLVDRWPSDFSAEISISQFTLATGN